MQFRNFTIAIKIDSWVDREKVGESKYTYYTLYTVI